MYTNAGTMAAGKRHDWVKEYAPLVKRVAHHMIARLPPNVELDDIMQAGMMGLLDAVHRYEEVQGAQFETYAAQRIRGAILDELRGADWLPRSTRKDMRRIEASIHSLEQQLKRAPSEQEVARHMNVPLAEYQGMLAGARGYQILHYEDLASADGESFLDRNCGDDRAGIAEQLIDEELRALLVAAIEKLPEREKLAMSLYYEQDLNLREIGEVLGVSESRVCQLHTQAVARLRARLNSR